MRSLISRTFISRLFFVLPLNYSGGRFSLLPSQKWFSPLGLTVWADWVTEVDFAGNLLSDSGNFDE